MTKNKMSMGINQDIEHQRETLVSKIVFPGSRKQPGGQL